MIKDNEKVKIKTVIPLARQNFIAQPASFGQQPMETHTLQGNMIPNTKPSYEHD
jgi:hypothetical protein